MDTSEQTPAPTAVQESPAKASSTWKWLGRLFRLGLLLAILGASGAISYRWLANPPVTQRRPPRPESVRVEVTPVTLGAQQVVVRAMGSVIPEREIQIAARVIGQVVDVSPHFEPGGRFKVGETLLRIDPKDYELALEQQEGNLTKVQSDVKLEMGQQDVAKREYEILGETAGEEDEELVLRRPQLAAKEAAVSIARATLDKARLDLERTEIVAPFNAFVQARVANLGSYVSPGAPLATLVGTDEFWVEVSVPVDELSWLDIPTADGEEGSKARIYNTVAWGDEGYRDGVVTRLLAALEPQGRMARLLVAVPDPLDLDSDEEPRRPLLLDSFVRVEIGGKDIENVANIPRTALREGRQAWVMTADSTLDIRDVDVVWSSVDRVYVSRGLSDGDLLVVSDLPAPVQGMALRTGDESSPAGKAAGRREPAS